MESFSLAQNQVKVIFQENKQNTPFWIVGVARHIYDR